MLILSWLSPIKAHHVKAVRLLRIAGDIHFPPLYITTVYVTRSERWSEVARPLQLQTIAQKYRPSPLLFLLSIFLSDSPKAPNMANSSKQFARSLPVLCLVDGDWASIKLPRSSSPLPSPQSPLFLPRTPTPLYFPRSPTFPPTPTLASAPVCSLT